MCAGRPIGDIDADRRGLTSTVAVSIAAAAAVAEGGRGGGALFGREFGLLLEIGGGNSSVGTESVLNDGAGGGALDGGPPESTGGVEGSTALSEGVGAGTIGNGNG